MLIKCIWIFNFDPLLCFHRVWGALHQCQRWTWVVQCIAMGLHTGEMYNWATWQWVFTLDGQIFFCRASLTLPSLFPISTPDHLEIFADQNSMFWGCKIFFPSDPRLGFFRHAQMTPLFHQICLAQYLAISAFEDPIPGRRRISLPSPSASPTLLPQKVGKHGGNYTLLLLGGGWFLQEHGGRFHNPLSLKN